jgi:hypothetical protein
MVEVVTVGRENIAVDRPRMYEIISLARILKLSVRHGHIY